MRAVRLVATGDPPVFRVEDVPDPQPGPGEAVVALRTAALNRRDPWLWTDPETAPLPVTLGSDGAGTVAAVGDGVAGVAVGDEVVVYPSLGWRRGEDVPGPEFDILGAPTDGTFAEQVLVPAGNLAPRPARLTWEESAAFPLAGLTAWRATAVCAGAGPGRTLLVTGAAGGVSTFAIQIGAALGARVFVTSSSDEKIARARELGAEAGFRSDDPTWPDQAREAAGGGLDAAVDSVGGPLWQGALRALQRGGVLVNYGDTASPDVTIEAAEVYWQWRSIVGTSMGSPEDFDALLAHIAAASWRPAIDSVLPLAEIDEAARRIGDPARFGKIVLSVASG